MTGIAREPGSRPILALSMHPCRVRGHDQQHQGIRGRAQAVWNPRLNPQNHAGTQGERLICHDEDQPSLNDLREQLAGTAVRFDLLSGTQRETHQARVLTLEQDACLRMLVVELELLSQINEPRAWRLGSLFRHLRF